MDRINLVVDNQQNEVEITEEITKGITEVIEEVLKELSVSVPVEISLVFTNDEGIREINKGFRNKDTATDVLSFPQLEFEEAGVIPKEDEPYGDAYPVLLLGDIVLSVERALEQAKSFGHSDMREIGYLVAHSMFHLMGFDHEEEDEKKIMRHKEEKVLEKIGMVR